MKRLPQGLWKDTGCNDGIFRVLYYDSRSKCYRIEYLNMVGVRVWAPVEDFGPGKRYQSMGSWGLLLLQKIDRRAGRPILSAADAIL